MTAERGKKRQGNCTVTQEQLDKAGPKFASDPVPCKEPIEARGVCRRHYSALKRSDQFGPAVPRAARTSSGGASKPAPSFTIDDTERHTRDEYRDPDVPLVNHIASYDVHLEYVIDKSVPKSKRTLSSDEMVWVGTALVDMDAGVRRSNMSEADIGRRHRERINTYIRDHWHLLHGPKLEWASTVDDPIGDEPLTEDQKKLLMALTGEGALSRRSTYEYMEEYRSATPENREILAKGWDHVGRENTGDYWEQGGLDRQQGRRVAPALRQIDLVKGAKKLGLTDEHGHADLGSSAILQQVLAAIEENRIRS